jgi:hypothetical protein
VPGWLGQRSARNEDWSNPQTRIWFVPGGSGRHGCVYVGFDDDWAQGGLNTEGLAFDWVAGFEEQWGPDPKKESAKGNSAQRMHTIVSTGPILLADINGQPPGTTFETGQSYSIRVQAWARGDEPDHLQRIELWSGGKAITTRTFDGNPQQIQETMAWQPLSARCRAADGR